MSKCKDCFGAAAGDCASCKWNHDEEFEDEHSVCELCTDGELWERREEKRMNDKWNTIKDDGLPPVGSCLIVTIKNHGYGGRRELRYPVHYLEKNYAPGYAFYMNGTDILLPEYSEVVAWMPIPMPYEGGI